MTPQFEMVIQLATLASIVGGIIFSIMELRGERREHAERAAIEVFSVLFQDSLNSVLYNVLTLPQDVSPEHIAESPDARRDAQLLVLLYEYWGNLVFQRMLPLRHLDLHVGGAVRTCWLRLHRYIEWERAAMNLPTGGEWLQWLAERLEQYPQPEKQVGAHIAFADWRP